MKYLENNLLLFIVLLGCTAPGLFPAGDSHFPIWAPIILIYFFKTKFSIHRVIFLNYILLILVLKLLLYFPYEIPLKNYIYHISMIMMLILAFHSDVVIRFELIKKILIISAIVNLLIIGIEFYIPDLCLNLGFLKQVRQCSIGRPAGLYAEPSHIATLAILLLLSSLFYKINWKLFILGCSVGFISFSFSFLACFIIILAWHLLRNKKFITVFILISLLIVLLNLIYLQFRANEILVSNQSFDKRSLYLIQSIFNSGIFPSITEILSETNFYLQNNNFISVALDNPEFDFSMHAQQVYNFSITSSAFYYFGFVGFYFFVKLIPINSGKLNSYHGLILSILLFGFPPGLTTFFMMVNLFKIESNNNKYE